MDTEHRGDLSRQGSAGCQRLAVSGNLLGQRVEHVVARIALRIQRLPEARDSLTALEASRDTAAQGLAIALPELVSTDAELGEQPLDAARVATVTIATER